MAPDERMLRLANAMIDVVRESHPDHDVLNFVWNAHNGFYVVWSMNRDDVPHSHTYVNEDWRIEE